MKREKQGWGKEEVGGEESSKLKVQSLREGSRNKLQNGRARAEE